MSHIYEGGLTGGQIGVGYKLEYLPETMCTKITVEVHYNGKVVEGNYTHTFEILSTASDEDIQGVVEMAVIQTLSDIILEYVDTEGLANKMKQVNAAKGGIIDDDDPLKNFTPPDWYSNYVPNTKYQVSSNPDGTYTLEAEDDAVTYTSPVDTLIAACPALQKKVKYPRHLDPDADWPPQETDDLKDVIINLNDRMAWSFDRIADWVESLDLDINIDLESLEGGES